MTDEIKIPKAPSILQLGPSGAGKTTALATLISSGIELFVIITEPNGEDSLLDAVGKLPSGSINKLHYHVVAPSAAGWAALTSMATTINAMSYEDISKIKQGVGKSEQKQLNELLNTMKDFKDDRTGQSFGDVTLWDDTRALALDSLSGFNLIAMAHTIGYKPSAHQGEWGIAMNLEEQVLLKLTSDCRCFFILNAHLDRSQNDVTGATEVGPAALGNKLGPRIPRFFSEVVAVKRVGPTFTWSTSDATISVKNRALPISDKLPQDFTPIVDAHRRRVTLAKGTSHV